MSTEDQNNLARTNTQGVAQGTNALGNLFSLNDLISGQSMEDLEKNHENQKKLKNDFVSNKEEMRKKLKLLEYESILFIGDATFRKENDMNNFRLIILTEYRFIFEFYKKIQKKKNSKKISLKSHIYYLIK